MAASIEDVNALRKLDPSSCIVLDTETTGVDTSNDEVLSIAIIDGTGKKLYDGLVKPKRKRKWKEAEAVHGISPKHVANAPTMAEVADVVGPMVNEAALVVGYNVTFDIQMLRSSGLFVKHVEVFDVMREFARLAPEGRWPKLGECARHYGYRFRAHDALEDAKATLHCLKALLRDERYLKAVRSGAMSTPGLFERIKFWCFMAVVGFIVLLIVLFGLAYCVSKAFG